MKWKEELEYDRAKTALVVLAGLAFTAAVAAAVHEALATHFVFQILGAGAWLALIIVAGHVYPEAYAKLRKKWDK